VNIYSRYLFDTSQ